MDSRRACLKRILAVGLLLSASLCLAADPAAPAATSRVSQPNPAADVATWLLLGSGDESANAVDLAGRIVPLTPAQRAQLAALARQLEADKVAAIARLNKAYADKVRPVLDADQRTRYDGVLAALSAMDAELTAAREEFVTSVGPEASAALPPRHVPIADATEFLPLDEQKRAGIRDLRETLNAALQDALIGRVGGEPPADLEAWRERRRQFVEARQKAEADYSAGLDALLSPDERKQLARAEAAVDTYNRRIREARRQAAAGLLELLQPDALAPEPQGQPPDPAPAGG
jgi:hypothetical protein